MLVFLPIIISLPEPEISPPVGRSIGLLTPISLPFPENINPGSVESRLSLQPDIPVIKKWDGNVLTIRPNLAFTPNTDITIRLSSGAITQDGRVYKKELAWQYKIRMPGVAFVGQATTSPEIWVTDPMEETGKKVTNTRGNVTDFVPFPDGAGFLYSVKNDLGGADIHRINRDGSQDQIEVNCGRETCGDLDISRDGKLFTFSRNRDPEDATTSSRSYIYTGLIASASGQPTPLLNEKSIPGILPSFSPDVLKAAFYDVNSKGIRVMNRGGSNDFLLGTNRIQGGSWSSDGSKIAFVDDVNEPENVYSRLYTVDLVSGTIDEPLIDILSQVELGEPDWSPDGTEIVVGVRAVNGPVARQLWLLDLKGKFGRQITDDFTLMNAAPKWRPDGKAIVFQQAQLGSSGTKPKIIVWDASDGTFTTVASDAAMPAWIP